MTPAILLRAIPYGESDKVVTLLGRDTGRVSALARGARKSVRRFSGGLGLGALGEASLRDRPGADLMVLEAFEVSDARSELGADVARTAHAAYVIELVDRLCAPRQPEPALYDWLATFLQRLSAGAATTARLRVFELGLLQRLGIGPVLHACAACQRVDLGDEMVRWQPDRGGVVCRGCSGQGSLLAADARKALVALAATSLADADALSLPKALNATCRDSILELLRTQIPTPLKSLEFMAKFGGVA